MKKFNLTDLIIIILLFIFSFAGIFYGKATKEGKYVIISSPEGLYSYSLEINRIIKLNGKLGSYQIEIKNGSVSIIESHCPKKICQKFKISKVNDGIVCPPNMITVRIIGEEKDNIDGITE
ncbi:MAG: NusG domain II-containing protein [Brevinematales bacterium]|nr:NusG domain II-containing protein [Brevinematales bacterium]